MRARASPVSHCNDERSDDARPGYLRARGRHAGERELHRSGWYNTLRMPARITPERLEVASNDIRAFYQELSALLLKRGMKALPEVRMYVSRKLKKNYGYASFRKKGDKLHVEKIAIAWSAYRQGKSMWQDVVAHEAAHIYCMHYHNRADHSPAWRHVAQLLGCTGDLVGCEDPRKRERARLAADRIPTHLSKLGPRDKAAIKNSYRHQRSKHIDELTAIEATANRFPQFDPQVIRRFLLQLSGRTIPRQAQMALPF